MAIETISVKKAELFYQSERSKIYRGSSDQGDIILLKDDLTGDKSRLYNEANVTEKTAHQSLHPQILIYEGRTVIVRKFIPGKSLNKLIPENGLDPKAFLVLAIRLAKELDRVHRLGLLHNDVNPKNFIINLKSQEASLIDFEFSSSMSSQRIVYDSRLSIAGTVDYISPEQTGRMNRKTDQRSDLYGLGATFYEMITGSPPFRNKDFIGMIHAHLAVAPDPPSWRKAEISPAIDAIVLKLLSKSAEDRYQSIKGLLEDLAECLAEFENEPFHRSFSPGKSDISSKLLLSQKLFGRKKEIELLEKAYEGVDRSRKVICVVKGESGVGKSEVCKELSKKISLNQSLFISGTFDVMDRQSPYVAFAQAFEKFSDWLITSDSEEQKKWKKILSKHLGGFGQVLIDLAPKLRHSLSQGSDLLPLSGMENQQRIQFAINLFLEAITSTDQKLVLYLDDFQWANEASIELLQSICKNKNLKNLLLLISHRSHEVAEEHLLAKTLAKIRQHAQNSDDLHYHSLEIGQLSREDVAHLMTETLKTKLDEDHEFIALIYSKSQGNPFAIAKLVESLHSNQLIEFDSKKSQWTWDLDQLRKENLSENILDILVKKLDKLDKEVLSLVKTASVFGMDFSLSQLAMITGSSPADIHRLLWPLIQDGSLLPLQNDYRFLPDYYAESGLDISFRFAHGRLQQAVYSLLSDLEMRNLHFAIGEVFLEKWSEEEIQQNPIEVAVHFLLGKPSIEKSPRRKEIGEILILAGKKSAESAAFESALNFDLLGEKILASSLSPSDRLHLFLRALESAYLAEKNTLKADVEKQAFAHARTVPERLLVYEVLIRCLSLENLPQQAVEKTQEALAEAGIQIPDQASVPQVLWELVKMSLKLPASKFDGLSELPKATDEQFLALAKVLYASFPSYLFSNPQTYPIVILKMLELTLKFGLAPSSVTGIASYGLILITAMKQPKNGYAIVQKALELIQKSDQKMYTATVHMVYGCFAAHLKNSPVDTYPYFEVGFQKGVEYGNMEYAGWNVFFKATLSFHLGKSLHEIMDEVKRARRFASLYNFQNQSSLMEIAEKSLEIIGAEEDQLDAKLKDWLAHPPKEKQIALEEKNEVYLYTYYGDCANLLLWFGKNEQAFDMYEQFKVHSKNQPPGFFTQYENFNRALNALILVLKTNQWKRGKVSLKAIIQAELKLLKKLMKLNSGIYGAFYHFLKSYYDFALTGKIADQKIEQSIQMVKQEKHLRHLVLFAELYSEQAEDERQRESYRNLAIQTAKQINSMGKVKALLGLSSSQENDLNHTIAVEKISHQSNSFEISSIDTMTLIKSMDALIGEIKLEPLLQKLLTYAMENSGAQEGHFLVNGSSGWTLEVSTRANPKMSTIFPKVNLSQTQEISQSIINYAKGTKESLLIHDAINTAPYSSDPIVRSKSIRSVLCIPFINQSKNSGIIYLTHSGTPDAFQKEHINLMRLMAGQIAGIIENALLYKNMEDLVKERTLELEEEKKKSDGLLLNILPKEVAQELIDKGHSETRHHDLVSVMFIDIKDFTSLAEQLSPQELVRNLHEIFGRFDAIMDEFGLEKIKTIGDAYMAAGGVPSPSADHPRHIVLAAQKILGEMEEMNQLKKLAGEPTFHFRIGIHVGPVVAGVVGNKKFAYDIWGDTVNIASRMESSSIPGGINISESLYQLIKEEFDCKYRGEIEVKNKGMMNMYFVNHPSKTL